MICTAAKKKGGAAVGRRRDEALRKAGRLLGLAWLRPDEDAKALVVTTAPRSPEEAERPDHRRSFCAYVLCAAEAAAPLAGRDAEFLELAGYFLERLPRAPRRWRGRLDRSLAGG